MRRLRRILPLALVLLTAACAPSAVRAQAPDTTLVAEARAFMEAYGRDLAAGNREGIAARYDRGGPYIMFNGEREMVPWEELATQYRTTWRAPAAFEWRDLVFLPAGPDAVVVNGHFFWTRPESPAPTRLRYTALLVRQDGELRIRLEDESVAPARAPAPPATP
ncbi:MAG TPA: hypothetical protein VLK84_21360 [Longimicrobium sp.]|nr:hypothetical protein [Longimicrobium sp.]